MIRQSNSPSCGRRGVSLLDTILSLGILAVLFSVLVGALLAQVRLMQAQENGGGRGIAESASRWIDQRIRAADDVRILGSDRLEMTRDVSGIPSVQTIYRSGDRLISEVDGIAETVTDSISALRFTDPDGRAVSVGVTVETPAIHGNPGPTSSTRVVPLDWIRS